MTRNSVEYHDLANGRFPKLWVRYKQRNFYTYTKANNKVLASYDTIVGLVIDKVAYTTTTKYSPTTSKQITEYCREQNLERIPLENSLLDKLLIKYDFVS
jgi:hypothetical protein